MQDPKVAELLAAEYVLGTLKGCARRRFQALLRAHPALRRRVCRWEYDLAVLLGPAPAVPPPPEAWAGIEKRLFSAAETKPDPWYGYLVSWRNLALTMGVLAGILAVLLMMPPDPGRPGHIVLINDSLQRPVWLVGATPGSAKLYVKNLKPLAMAPATNCVLWLQLKGVKSLYPAGALPDSGESVTLVLDDALHGLTPERLLVTVEAVGAVLPATPTGSPEFQAEWLPIVLEARSGG